MPPIVVGNIISQHIIIVQLFNILYTTKKVQLIIRRYTSNTVGNDMDGVPGFRHIKAGGFHAAGRVRAGDVKLIDPVFPDIRRKPFARQRVGLRLDKNLIRHDL